MQRIGEPTLSDSISNINESATWERERDVDELNTFRDRLLGRLASRADDIDLGVDLAA
jgi:hypothetical protein